MLDCGDDVRLLGNYSAPPQSQRGLVIMLHGWEGSAEANYVVSVGGALYAAGFEVFRLNFRDHGATHELNNELFHSCRIDEVVDATKRITEAHGRARTFLVGHSLGGNFALRVAVRSRAAKLVTHQGRRDLPSAAAAQHDARARRGAVGLSEYFLQRWRRSLLAKAACFPTSMTSAICDGFRR